jgi:uncharacterized membrane protein
MDGSNETKPPINLNDDGLIDIARVASFSDNVISIALTLLVLDVRLPPDLVDLHWRDVQTVLLPRLLSFLLSFAIVGVYWVAHHTMFRVMQHAGRLVLWLNNLVLLTISLVPASAAILGSHGRSSIATMLYGINIACVGSSFLALLHYTTLHHRRRGTPLDHRLSVAAYQRTIVGICIALTGAAMGFVSPRLSYGIYWLAPIAYIFVQSTPTLVPAKENPPKPQTEKPPALVD